MNKLLRKNNKVLEKFKLRLSQLPLQDGEVGFRHHLLNEEVQEFKSAENTTDQLDALVDIAIVLMGTVERLGFTQIFDRAYNIVCEANATKIVGPSASRSAKFSFPYDLKKPENFESPNVKLKKLIEKTLLKEDTYGDFSKNSKFTQRILRSLKFSSNNNYAERECVQMILHKLARVKYGKTKTDNYRDILGYFLLWLKNFKKIRISKNLNVNKTSIRTISKADFIQETLRRIQIILTSTGTTKIALLEKTINQIKDRIQC